MNSYLLRELIGISSAAIKRFLTLLGWQNDDSFKNRNIWLFRNPSDSDISIAVPSTIELKDFYPRLYDVVQILCQYLDKDEQNIIDSLKSVFSDRIRFRIITDASENGKIPLDYAAQCLAGFKNLVLYAACAEENARPICYRALVGAQRNTSKFQFAQTEVGSFVFNVDVQVADETFEQLFINEASSIINDPIEHRIIKRIDTAFSQVNRVVNEEISISQLVSNAYLDGITANMCDAITQIRPEKGEDIKMEASIFFAEAITHSINAVKTNLFSNSHFSYVDEISKRYKDCTLIEDVSLTGTIKMIAKNNVSDEVEDSIRLQTKMDGKLRSINLNLSPAHHILACNAYRDDKEVTVTGTLDKSNKFWFLSEVTDFKVLD